MKKFIDSARHDESWFVDLPVELKAAYDFVWAKADGAGVWNGSTKIADIQIGKKIDWKKLVESTQGRMIQLPSGALYLTDYVRLQCGELNESCPPHRTVIKLLRSHGLLTDASLIVSLPSSLPVDYKNKKGQEEEKDGRGGGETKEPPKRKDRGTLEEIVAFCVSEGLPVSDGEACFHKWEGNGWMNKEQKIADWKATIRSWKTQKYLPSLRTPNGHNSKPAPQSAHNNNLNRDAVADYQNIRPNRRFVGLEVGADRPRDPTGDPGVGGDAQ